MPKSPYADFIEGIANEGITAGCGTPGDPKFCPGDPIKREQAAVWIWKAMVRAQRSPQLPIDPPPCTGIFNDVQCGADPEPIPNPPLAEIKFSTAPYLHSFNGGQVYSGNFVVLVQNWGVVAVNTFKPTWAVNGGMVSPVTSTSPNLQPAAFCRCDGDFHQSISAVCASSGVAKWVVGTVNSLGTHFNCKQGGIDRIPSKVQVYKLTEANGLKYHGQVDVDCSGAGEDVIIGDIAYIQQGDGTYIPVDLNTLEITSAVPSPPGEDAQNDINGYTYKLELDGVQPPTGASKLVLRRYAPTIVW